MDRYLADCHIHSMFSFDSDEKIDNIAKSAKERGLSEIYITEHFSVLENDPSYEYFRYDEYIKSLTEASGKYNLRIKSGLEIGEGHRKSDEIEKIIGNYDLDFIIGSIHNIGDKTLRITYREEGFDSLYEKYFKELYMLSCSGNFDVIGHLDLAQRYSWAEGEKRQYELKKYSDIIDEILKKIIYRGKGIEINTSFIKGERRITLPRHEIINRYRELGGEIITVGSDSHKANRIGENIDYVYDILACTGFSYITSFEKRKPEFIKLK